MEQEFFVISFEATHYAIMAEKKLKEKKYYIEMIPTPRAITASCGLSVKVSPGVIGDILNELRTWDMDFNLMDVYRIEKNKGRDLATHVDWKNSES